MTIFGTLKYMPKYGPIRYSGCIFGHAKYGQVGCPEKILQNAVQTQCLGFKMMCAGEILDESRYCEVNPSGNKGTQAEVTSW